MKADQNTKAERPWGEEALDEVLASNTAVSVDPRGADLFIEALQRYEWVGSAIGWHTYPDAVKALTDCPADSVSFVTDALRRLDLNPDIPVLTVLDGVFDEALACTAGDLPQLAGTLWELPCDFYMGPATCDGEWAIEFRMAGDAGAGKATP